MTPTTIVRYTTRPDAADENARLITEVFAELARTAPAELRYAALRLEGDQFLHLAWSASQPSPLFKVEAFARFREGIAQRCIEGPLTARATLLGNYGLFGP